MKQIDTFIKLVAKLDTTEFIGLAKVLKVSLVKKNEEENAEKSYVPRLFSEVFEDVLKAFEDAPRARKREILQLLKAATKKGGAL